MNDLFTITLLCAVISSIFCIIGGLAASKAILFFMERY